MRKTIYTDLDAIFGARFVRENELNFIATRDMLTNIEKLLDKHSRNETKAHTAEQIKYTLPTGPNTTVHKELHYQNERVKNLVLGNLGNGQQEVRDSRVSMDGQSHSLLSERLKHDFSYIEEETDKLMNVTDDPAYLFNPPYMKSAERGVNETPLSNDPTENLKAFYDVFVDNKYCFKKYIGKDQSNKYNVYSYTFEPEHYSKTVLVTCCIHGNEYSAFYAMSRFMNLVVNEWEKYPQLAYLRKNVRIVMVPIVNPWGFANQERENVNNVDLNRNFDYYWENGSGKSPSGKNYKGSKVFSERESRNMKTLVESLDEITAHMDCHNIVSQVSDYCLFYPRFANQPNNEMTQLLMELSNYGDYVTWGSSTLASFSNWVGITKGITSFLPEVYEGRAGKPRGAEEMWRSVYYLGNILLRLSSLYNGQNGRTANEPIVKSFVYSSRYNNSGVKPFSLIAKDGYQRMLMTQQRFKVTANGFVELNGSITVQLSKDTVFGVNPGVAQNYNPFSGNGKTRRRQLFKIEHKLPAGIHTIPLHAVAPVQFSTTTPDNVKRTNEVMAVVDVMRKEGYAKVLNMVLNVKFTPSHSHNAVQMFTSTGYGNQKEQTFKQIYPNKPAPFDVRNKIITKK